ncbi:hypothetical protein KCU81_g8244, partial [Aureobasidium melanogenum]|uniref:Uncharacterized protein n=1 Tax=Aureobasidium melanogenum (strain CBS 110374) TaxID=1043003 RepID=A0A074VVV1_AURM1
MQEVIRKLARLGNATYEASKSYDNSFSFHAVELLREAAGYPLWRKHVVNPKAEKTPEEKQELEEKRRKKEEKKKKKQGSEQAELVEEEERPVTRSKGMQPPRTPEPRDTSPDDIQMCRMTPSKHGNNWQSTWHIIAEKLSPETKKNLLKVLTRTFSHVGANDALDMAESIIDDHINMDLVKSVASDSQIRQSDSPATTTVLRCKTLWEEEKPKLLLKAQHLHNYLLLATEFKNLQTQALSPDTPSG